MLKVSFFLYAHTNKPKQSLAHKPLLQPKETYVGDMNI